MAKLTLASVNPAVSDLPVTQWAHDIRNALSIMSLHLETLERLSGSGGRKAAGAAQVVMKRVSDMCNAAHDDQRGRRRGFDLSKTIKEIIAILAPIVPDGFEIRFAEEGACIVMGDPNDVFRIIFNLVQNAIAVARNGCKMSHVEIQIEYASHVVTVRISDDGPGLPRAVRANLFRPQASSKTGGQGLGIAIARELAERNGAALRLSESTKGASFVLELVGVRSVGLDIGAAMPSLGSARKV